MRIIHIPRRFDTAHWGGTETVILQTNRCLHDRGHQSKIITTDALADSPYDTIEGVDVERVPYFYPYLGLDKKTRRRLDHQGGNLFSFSLIKRLWQQRGADLFHLHTGKRMGGIARTVARLRGIPYVISIHGGFLDVPHSESQRYTAPTEGAWEWGKLLGWMVGSRRVLDDAEAILCVSRQEQRKLQQALPDQKVYYLPNGVNTAAYADGDGQRFRRHFDIDDDQFLITVVGRIDAQKNQLLALKLLHRLRQQGLAVHLCLVGATTDDTYRQLLLDTVDRLRLQDHITWTGNLGAEHPSIAGAYGAADLALVPSLHEPFGIVVLEAWASQTPVMAANVGGLSELVTDNHTGALFDPSDLDGLVQRATGLIGNRRRRRFLIRQARRAVENYSWSSITDRLLQIYRDIQDRHHTKSAGVRQCS